MPDLPLRDIQVSDSWTRRTGLLIRVPAYLARLRSSDSAPLFLDRLADVFHRFARLPLGVAERIPCPSGRLISGPFIVQRGIVGQIARRLIDLGLSVLRPCPHFISIHAGSLRSWSSRAATGLFTPMGLVKHSIAVSVANSDASEAVHHYSRRRQLALGGSSTRPASSMPHRPPSLSASLALSSSVPQKVKGSAIDGRMTRHAGYGISQQKRKLIEQVFGWMKSVGGLRKLRHRGGELVDWIVTFTAAA